LRFGSSFIALVSPSLGYLSDKTLSEEIETDLKLTKLSEKINVEALETQED
jgi:hypothetical protein